MRTYILATTCLAMSLTMSCRRSSDEVWRDTKSAGRHVKRGVGTLGGKHGESRAVVSDEEFYGAKPQAKNEEFIALSDDADAPTLTVTQAPVPQPKETPGELGSTIPGIDAFKDPSEIPELASLFQHIHFEYNSSLVKSDENLATMQKIATYMKSHPTLYIFVEGHCDKRGPAAFNYALGANRSNTVRSFLINEGVSPDQLFTVSYGKDRPLVEGDSEEFYQLNRRAQFRVYEKPQHG